MRQRPSASAGTRTPPERLERLPEQYFVRILGRVAAARARDGDPLIDLGRGNPDLPPPPHVIGALQRTAAERTALVHGYPPFRGTPSLREAVAERYRLDHGVELDPEREVAVIPGTKTGISMVALAAAERGSVVALPDPGYPDYPSGVALASATAEPLRLDPTAGWQPDFDAFPAAARERLALTLLNYPSNPVAACERDGTFERAVAFAQETGSWLLHDLAYGFLAFDGRRARSVLEAEGAREVAVELWSTSKIYGMAGWRVGFCVGNAELVERVKELCDHLFAGVFYAVQAATEAALRGPQDDVAARRAVYEARRDRLVATLRAAGADIAPPEGTFYAWLRLPQGLTAEQVLDEARVAIAPGEGFGATGAGYARLSFAVADADLDEGARRLAQVIARASG
jgi:aminotransferase